jgi:hypothetical protein
MIEDFRKVIQDFLAPELRTINARIDAMNEKMDYRFKSLEEKMDLRFDALNGRFDSLVQQLNLEKKMEDLQRRVEQQEVKQ